MKQTLSSLFIMIFAFSFSQNQLKVINSKNQKPIYNASVYCDDDLLGKTDANGNLSFKTKCKKVEIFANNFEDKEVEVKKSMEIALKPSSEKSGNIDIIVLSGKSDAKALKILDEVYKRHKENAPQSLDSYDFKSYSKISMDVDKDSIKIFYQKGKILWQKLKKEASNRKTKRKKIRF